MAINFPEGTQNYPGRVHRVYSAHFTSTQIISISSAGENVWYDVTNLSIATVSYTHLTLPTNRKV